MILGVGCDLCDIRRIEKILKNHGEAFLKKVFLESEIKRLLARAKQVEGLAKVFAAKEATVKALGVTENLAWKNIEIVKNANGGPLIELNGAARATATRLAGGAYNLSLSLSDEYPYAMAYAIFSKG